MLYSKNLLFLFFAHWFLWAVLLNNIFEYKVSFLVLTILWVLFLLYIITYNKFLYYFVSIVIWIIWWIFISQIEILELNTKNNIVYNHSKEYINVDLEIEWISENNENVRTA